MNLLETTYREELSLLIESEEEVLYKFCGASNHKKTTVDQRKLTKILEELGESFSNVKRVVNVFIEAAQNATSHGKKRNNYTNSYFILYLRDGKYCLAFSNEVTRPAQEHVMRYLDWVLSMTTKEIKKKFLEILVNTEFTAKGNGGLGLLLIAKTGNQIAYNALSSESNDEHLFHIEVSIP